MNNLFLSLAVISIITSSCSQEQKESVNAENKTLVFMEEAIQNVNVVQADRGLAFYNDVKSEFFSLRPQDENTGKRQKLEIVIQKMNSIDRQTSKIIEYIDQLKKELLQESGEDARKVVVKEMSGVYPDQLKLYDLKNPNSQVEIVDTINLFQKIVGYRDSLVHLCANYDWNSKSFRLPIIGSIRNYSSNAEFEDLLSEKLNATSYNYMEDMYILMDLYTKLHHASLKVIDQRNKTLITNLCLLSALQQDVLASRALAMMNWKSKVSTGEFDFNSIRPMIDGADIVKSGTESTFKVFVAAVNSEQKPEIKVNSNKDVQIKYNDDGTYSITVSADKKGSMKLSGTISIKNKSGILLTESWEKTILVE